MNLFQKFWVWSFFIVTAASPAYADIMLTGKHNLVAVQPDGAGSLLTFNIALSNAGTSSLSYAKLVAKDPLILADAATDSRLIGVLSVGDTVTMDWTVHSSLPSDQLNPGMDIPFNIQVEAADDTGKITSFQVTSKGGTL